MPPANLGRVRAIDITTFGKACAIREDQSLACWGEEIIVQTAQSRLTLVLSKR